MNKTETPLIHHNDGVVMNKQVTCIPPTEAPHLVGYLGHAILETRQLTYEGYYSLGIIHI